MERPDRVVLLRIAAWIQPLPAPENRIVRCRNAADRWRVGGIGEKGSCYGREKARGDG